MRYTHIPTLLSTQCNYFRFVKAIISWTHLFVFNSNSEVAMEIETAWSERDRTSSGSAPNFHWSLWDFWMVLHPLIVYNSNMWLILHYGKWNSEEFYTALPLRKVLADSCRSSGMLGHLNWGYDKWCGDQCRPKSVQKEKKPKHFDLKTQLLYNLTTTLIVWVIEETVPWNLAYDGSSISTSPATCFWKIRND